MVNPQLYTTVPPRDHREPPWDIPEPGTLDWSARLSLDMIRSHTKTDDVPAVTDAQLNLYRGAALEAAEFYTGLLLGKQTNVTEPVQGPARPRYGHHHYSFRLRYPVAGEVVYIYGSKWPADNMQVRVTPGQRTIRVPIRSGYLDLSNCCDPCSDHHMNGGMVATYTAGFPCAEAVPNGIVLGLLQYLAWIVQHPGDELLTIRNKEGTTGSGVQGSNNVAMASGALEQWRQYNASAI